jgi:DNA-binding response OmpR family regulator
MALNLENEGYNVNSAFSIGEAFKKLTPDYNLILIDAIVKNKREYSFVEKCHYESGIPIIFLPELKPFIFKDLFDHVRSVLKHNITVENFIKAGDIFMEPSSKKVKIGNSIISLTKIEFEIFYMLASNPLKPHSRKQIIDAIWKDSGGYITKHTVNTHITRLRKKLGSKANCIVNRRGFGYEFNPQQPKD